MFVWKVEMIGSGETHVREVVIPDDNVKFSYVILMGVVDGFGLGPEQGVGAKEALRVDDFDSGHCVEGGVAVSMWVTAFVYDSL